MENVQLTESNSKKVKKNSRDFLFTKRKFLTFSITQQHKKCSELLREIYLNSSQKLLNHYNEIQQWMGGNLIDSFHSEVISNAYHKHLKLSKRRNTEHNLLPKVRQNDRAKPSCKPLPIATYLDSLRSAHNIGSILRTVEAFGLGEVYFSLQTPFCDHPQVIKTSMGTSQHVKCFKVENIADLPKPLIVMETCEQSIPLHEFQFPDKFTLAIGNEEYGCSKELLLEADTILEIPLRGRKNSLNVANAFAIAAAEIVNQKDKTDKEAHGQQLRR
jgi:tRNA G18 (ribose-2'-O)-methylase SpoU